MHGGTLRGGGVKVQYGYMGYETKLETEAPLPVVQPAVVKSLPALQLTGLELPQLCVAQAQLACYRYARGNYEIRDRELFVQCH